MHFSWPDGSAVSQRELYGLPVERCGAYQLLDVTHEPAAEPVASEE